MGRPWGKTLEALPPNLHKPFEKGLTLNFIFNRAVARLVMGQGTASPHSLSTPKNHPTKMGSRQSLPHSRRSGYEGSDAMKKTDWKQEAASLFFRQGKSLVEIADLTGQISVRGIQKDPVFLFADAPGLYSGTGAAEAGKQAEAQGVPAGMGQEEPPLYNGECRNNAAGA